MNNKNNRSQPPPGAMFPFAPIVGQQPQALPPLELSQIIDPTFDLILVEKLSMVGKGSKLHLPQEVTVAEQNAVVVKVGPGRLGPQGVTSYPCCKPGDRVFTTPGNGIPLKVQGREMWLMTNESILGIYVPEPEPVVVSSGGEDEVEAAIQ